jgi:capsular exopolysaccharide synthesis family protein
MSAAEILKTIAARRWVVVIVFAITVGAAAAFAYTKPKEYESTATVAFLPKPVNGNIVSSDDLQSIITTYAQTVQSEVTLQRAARLAGGALPGTVSTGTQAGSGVLQIIGRAGEPAAALLIARSTTAAFMSEGANSTVLSASVIGPPTLPTTPVQPRPPLIIGIGAVLGLLLGALVALLYDRLYERVETADDLALVTDAPVIGTLPTERRLRDNARIGETELHGALQESIRGLRANIEILIGSGNHTILVTSATTGQGKSTIAAHLGRALAQTGTRTTIVDADLRRPTQHQIFGIDSPIGLAGLLPPPQPGVSGADAAALAVVDTPFHGLSLLPAGHADEASSPLLPVRFPLVLEVLHINSSIVLVDAPPLLAVSDARVLAAQCDAVLLVTRARAETPRAVRAAIDRLALLQCNLLGVVLNGARAIEHESEYHYSA